MSDDSEGPLKYAEHGVVSWCEYEPLRAERDRLLREVERLKDWQACAGELKRRLTRERDEARAVARKLLHIAECRGPGVFGAEMAYWLRHEDEERA